MALLWAFIAASALCAGAAGASAVMLVRDGQGDVKRLQLSVIAVQEHLESAQKQIEAQRILLGQASAWMQAQRPAVSPLQAPK